MAGVVQKFPAMLNWGSKLVLLGADDLLVLFILDAGTVGALLGQLLAK